MKDRGIILSFMGLIALVPGFGFRDAWADARRGRALAEQWCAECHAVAPNKTAGDPAAPDFADVAAEPSATGYALRVFLRTPHATMPNFMLERGDIEDIV